ncbi:MAG: hypothetical protein ACI4GA_08480 [Acutalibacteraceae bacterium]|nr:hypothetical protein [Oscillospiraceae bacterium]
MLKQSVKSKAFISVLLISVLLAAVFCGCKAPQAGESPLIIKSFECDMKVVSRSRNYYCHFKRTDESSILTVKEPAELDGLELEYSSGVYSVSFKGLTMSLDDSKTQLTKHFADAVMNILDKTFSLESVTSRRKDGVMIYEGDTSYGKFEMRVDRDGKILGISIPKLDTEITVENFEEIK